tara:strand:+ start:402 stop:1118 length:717 start_codon:yes stop_codon:yes gene_type:complete
MNQTDYGFLPAWMVGALGARYANTYLYAKYLNYKYNYRSFTPEEATEQIALAAANKTVKRISTNLGTKGRVAPGGTVQAYVKSAYILALTSRYLNNPGLTALASTYIAKARKGSNSKSKGKIQQIMYNAGLAIQSAAGNRAKDPEIIMVLYTLGLRVRGKQRDLNIDIESTRKHTMDPAKEAEQSVKDLLDAPASYLRKLKKHRDAKKRAKARQKMFVGVALVTGVPFLFWALWPRSK